MHLFQAELHETLLRLCLDIPEITISGCKGTNMSTEISGHVVPVDGCRAKPSHCPLAADPFGFFLY